MRRRQGAAAQASQQGSHRQLRPAWRACAALCSMAVAWAGRRRWRWGGSCQTFESSTSAATASPALRCLSQRCRVHQRGRRVRRQRAQRALRAASREQARAQPALLQRRCWPPHSHNFSCLTLTRTNCPAGLSWQRWARCPLCGLCCSAATDWLLWSIREVRATRQRPAVQERDRETKGSIQDGPPAGGAVRRRAWRRTCRPNLGPSTSSACAASYPRRLRLAALPAAGQLPPRQLGLCGPAGPLPSPGGGTAVGQPADCCVSKLGPLPVHRAREVRVPCWQPGARRGAQASAERVSARGGAAPRPTLCCYTTVFTHRSTRRPASAPHPSHVTSPTQPRLPAHPSPPPPHPTHAAQPADHPECFDRQCCRAVGL